MAVATALGAALAEQHRQTQLRLRARALRDFLAATAVWHGDEASFGPFIADAVPLITVYQHLSAGIAGAYYRAARAAEQVPGSTSIKLAAAADVRTVTASLYVTGQVETRNAVASGTSQQIARGRAIVRMSGAASRHILDGGRDTIIGTVQIDEQAVGWARITDGNPCYFCLTLASRGAVYKSEQTADFQAHDHCGCSCTPVWEGTTIPNLDRWRDVYETAQREGEASGLLQPGANSSKARINAVRRYLAAAHTHP